MTVYISRITNTALLTTGLLFSTLIHSNADTGITNSWTNSVSGNWEAPGWSLGVLPALNQNIFITNAGWKAVAIGTNAAFNFPQTLSIDSLTIESPTNSFNELLMNYAGWQEPLVIGNSGSLDGSLVLGSNASIDMMSSALVVNNSEYMGTNETGAFSIGGTFTETDASFVSAGFVHVGNVGPAVFGLTNSVLTVQNTEYLGGTYSGLFHQQGGSNTASSLVLQAGGEYDIYGGDFSAGIEFQGGNFNQWGGNVTADLEYQFWLGNYRLAAGTLNSGNLSIPGIPPEGLPKAADGLLLQTGGTNFAGTIELGNNYGTGSYDLSNGVLFATGLNIGYFETPQAAVYGCTFTQNGGLHTNGGISIYGGYGQNYAVTRSTYALTGGTLQTPSLDLTMGAVAQSGGTNNVGTLTLNDVSTYQLQAGLLYAQTVAVSGGSFFGQIGGFTQNGGANVSGDLSLSNSAIYTLNGGTFATGSLEISGGSVFHHIGGSVEVGGPLTLTDATLDEGASGATFAGLELAGVTNSVLTLPATAVTVQFNDSSAISWVTNAVLTIQNWNGSITGGGQEQIYFGNNGAGLTAQQVSQIQFSNPSSLSAGTYSARILATGEVVPVSNTPTMGLAFNSNGAQLTLQGKVGQTYAIQISSDLQHWTTWTNQVNVSGSITINDTDTANHIARFYRAVVQ